MPTKGFDEPSDYEAKVRPLIEDAEKTIQLSETMCILAQYLLKQSKEVRVALHLEYHKRAMRR